MDFERAMQSCFSVYSKHQQDEALPSITSANLAIKKDEETGQMEDK